MLCDFPTVVIPFVCPVFGLDPVLDLVDIRPAIQVIAHGIHGFMKIIRMQLVSKILVGDVWRDFAFVIAKRSYLEWIEGHLVGFDMLEPMAEVACPAILEPGFQFLFLEQFLR